MLIYNAKTAIETIAQSMGAQHKYDLTSDVTHLIVGEVNTLKYKFVAKQRPDVKVVTVQWLYALRELWIGGEHIDVDALEVKHRLPTFHGLKISVTNFEDLQERHDITSTVEANGARYHGDLTKDITHLIAAKPVGAKYEAARHWHIKTVSIEWYNDSLQRGMVLDETLYNPNWPIEERGKGAITCKDVSPRALKRARESQLDDAAVSGRRKLRRSASSKLNTEHDDLWAEVSVGEHKQIGKTSSPWLDVPTTGTQSGAGVNISGPTDSNRVDQDDQTAMAQAETSGSRGFANTLSIVIDGFDGRQTSLLLDHLRAAGASIVSYQEMAERTLSIDQSDQVKVSLVIVPHNITVASFKEVQSKASFLSIDNFVTEWWVEKCLHTKRQESTSFVLHRPLIHCPIMGSKEMLICPTSFKGIDLLHFSKAVKLMGARYDECLRPETSVLVTNEAFPNSEKVQWARERNIPIVTAKWIWTCIEKGELQPFVDFSLGAARLNKRADSFGYELERSICHTATRKAKCAPNNNARSRGPHTLDLQPSRLRAEPQSRSDLKHLQLTRDKEDMVSPSPGHSSRVLRDLPPEVNSSRIQSQTGSQKSITTQMIRQGVDLDGTIDMTATTTVEEPASDMSSRNTTQTQKTAVIDCAISHLQARMAANRSSSAPSEDTEDLQAAHPRRRQLGRAATTSRLLRTASEDVSRETDTDASDWHKHDRQEGGDFQFRPSQTLSYEAPNARAARQKLLERVGLTGDGFEHDDEGGIRVEPVGVVKDAGTAVAGGASRRRLTRNR